jgi:hypothetical protein
MGVVLEVSYAYNDVETVIPKIEFRSVFGGEVYNQAKISVEDVLDDEEEVIGKKILLTKPDAKKAQIAEEPMEFSSLDYPTFDLIVQAINNAVAVEPARNQVFLASTNNGSASTANLNVNTGTYLIGGLSGLVMTTEEKYKALTGTRDSYGLLTKQGAFQLLENVNVDYVVPVGVYADDELPGRYDNFAYQLALFCAVLSYRNKMTFGVIGMKPVQDTDLAGLQAYSNYLKNYNNNYYMIDTVGNILKDEETGEEMDLGGFINVVAGPEIQVRGTSLGLYYTNAAVKYAAYSTVLQPQSSFSNKQIPGSLGLRYRLSDAQMNDIIGNRFTIAKRKFNNQIVILDDVTCAKIGSDYTRRTTGKVVREVTDHIREVCDPFLGEPNTQAKRNAMSALIEKRLGQLQTAEVIQRYEFQVIASVRDQLIGQLKIELTLVPPQELRKITTVVSLLPA